MFGVSAVILPSVPNMYICVCIYFCMLKHQFKYQYLSNFYRIYIYALNKFNPNLPVSKNEHFLETRKAVSRNFKLTSLHKMLGNDNFLSSLSRFVVAIVFHFFSGSVLVQVTHLDLSFFALAYPWFPAFADGRLRHVLGRDGTGDSGCHWRHGIKGLRTSHRRAICSALRSTNEPTVTYIS